MLFVILLVFAVALYFGIDYFCNCKETKSTPPPEIQKFETILPQSNNVDLDSSINSSTNDSNGFENPIYNNIDPTRNDIQNVNVSALNELIKEVNTGNTIKTSNPNSAIFDQKVNGRDKASNYRNVSYKDSQYRLDFNNDGISQESQNKLDQLYNNAIVFRDSEYQNNSNFNGMPDGMMNNNTDYASAGLRNFRTGPETEEQRILNLYNSNNYLPNTPNTNNNDMVDGFQIVNNPVSVTNAALIPVLKSMSVNSTLGSKRNMSLDLRGDIPNPKTVVSPFNNSSIQNDIYSSNRPCL